MVPQTTEINAIIIQLPVQELKEHVMWMYVMATILCVSTSLICITIKVIIRRQIIRTDAK
jgi:hypothetical protein